MHVYASTVRRLKLQRQQTQIAVLKLLPHTGLAEILQGLGRSLEKISRALADYLDVKRSSFPRLYMLSARALLLSSPLRY